jgi:hypothetical protein
MRYTGSNICKVPPGAPKFLNSIAALYGRKISLLKPMLNLFPVSNGMFDINEARRNIKCN